METHFYTMELFFFTSSLSYEYSEKINETALGINTKNVVSEMETICKLYRWQNNSPGPSLGELRMCALWTKL